MANPNVDQRQDGAPSEQPTPLDYASFPSQPRRSTQLTLLLTCLLIGSVVSGLMWIPHNPTQRAAEIVVVVKLATAGILVCIKPLRALGIGIWLSMAVGCLLFGFGVVSRCGPIGRM